MTNVQLFDRPCCGPSDAQKLADFLATRVAQHEHVAYHNLNDVDGAADVTVPGSVVSHIAAGKPLPVLVVDGTIAAAGTMPNLLDALDLLRGSAPKAALPLATVGAPSCGPDCC